MGVVTICAGLALWWLTPFTVDRDEETGRPMWRGIREFRLADGYVGAAVLIGLGVVILLVTATRAL